LSVFSDVLYVSETAGCSCRAMESQTSTQRVRGGASEPIELRAGTGVREAAREVELEQWAWRKVKSLRLLYSHLSIFVFGNVTLLLIDQATPGEAWFYKILVGWGLLVGLPAAYTYELLPWSTRDWEQRKVRELMDEQRQRSSKRR
jgi:2TM domain-containing protein